MPFNRNTLTTAKLDQVINLIAKYGDSPSFISTNEEKISFILPMLGNSPRDLIFEVGKFTPNNNQFTFLTFDPAYTPSLIGIYVDKPIGLNSLLISPTLGAAYPFAGLLIDKSILFRPVPRLDYHFSSIEFDARAVVVGSAVQQQVDINYLAFALIDS